GRTIKSADHRGSDRLPGGCSRRRYSVYGGVRWGRGGRGGGRRRNGAGRGCTGRSYRGSCSRSDRARAADADRFFAFTDLYLSKARFFKHLYEFLIRSMAAASASSYPRAPKPEITPTAISEKYE